MILIFDLAAFTRIQDLGTSLPLRLGALLKLIYRQGVNKLSVFLSFCKQKGKKYLLIDVL